MTDVIRLFVLPRTCVSCWDPFESPKESRLPVVASYAVVKEPTSVERAARLPDPSVRVKRNVFSVLNPFRLTRTPVTTRRCWLERSNCSGYCRDREAYVALAALSTPRHR